MKNANQVSIDDLRTNLSEIIGRVMYGQQKIIVKKYNRNAAIILSQQEYESRLDPTKRLSQQEWDAQFSQMDSIQKTFEDLEPEEIQQMVNQAVDEVRSSKKK